MLHGNFDFKLFLETDYSGVSTQIAIPIPPPMQSAATPRRLLSLLRLWTKVTRIRQP